MNFLRNDVLAGVGFGLLYGLLVHVAVVLGVESLLYRPDPLLIVADLMGIRWLFEVFPPAGYVAMALLGGVIGLVYETFTIRGR